MSDSAVMSDGLGSERADDRLSVVDKSEIRTNQVRSDKGGDKQSAVS